jgi:hypothetical protein
MIAPDLTGACGVARIEDRSVTPSPRRRRHTRGVHLVGCLQDNAVGIKVSLTSGERLIIDGSRLDNEEIDEPVATRTRDSTDMTGTWVRFEHW